ncbi:conserved Plasmodium protein, unknown function [Plasmodium chabaudi adami]|uniref:Uncharacterized protein n=1 Tax=Plasmodium chabaudi adami TaxID=5826 RepID=A0A1C6YAX0_PLACE|nr:conserved Plasmodium protein, unknown function [Plasmodium chabaudi adami]
MKITFSLFFTLVIVTKLNSKYNVYCAKGYTNESNEIKYAPYTFDLSSYDLGSQDNFLINLEHDEPKQNLRKKRNENPLEYSEGSNHNTEEYTTRNDANDTISHEQSEHETPTPEYPEQHSSTYEHHPTSNINESSLDTKLEHESSVQGGHPPYFNNVETEEKYYNNSNYNKTDSAEANYNTEHVNVNDVDTNKEVNEFIGAPGPHPHGNLASPAESSYNTEHAYVNESLVEGAPHPHVDHVTPAEAHYDREHEDANEFIGAPGPYPHVNYAGPEESNYDREHPDVNESFVEGAPHPHVDHVTPAEAHYNREHEDANEFIGAPGHTPHVDHVTPAEAHYNREHEDANEFIGAPGHTPHINHVDPASKEEDAWNVIAMSESKKKVDEPSYKTAEINQIFIKGIDLCKDIFDFRRTKSTYKHENNANNDITPEESENSENHQITVDVRDDNDPLPIVSKVYIIDNTLEQYMKDIYSILINIQNTIEKSKTVVE